MTTYPELFAALAAPFDPQEVKVRTGTGRSFHYITARTVMNRLDNVLGPEGWWDEYTPGENSVLCRLTIRLPDGALLTKSDAGGYAGMADQGDDDKSGFADALKRAAVKFGVARYLYRDGVPAFVQERVQAEPPAGSEHADTYAPPARRADPPPVSYAEPPRPHAERGPERPSGGGGGWDDGAPPRSGKALFAWVKTQEQRHEVGLLKYLNQWAKLQDFPGRMVDWDADQVGLAHREAVRKLASVADRGDSYEGPDR